MPRSPGWKRAAAAALKGLSAGRDVVRSVGDGAVVLLYHRVGGASGLAVDLPLHLFQAQIDDLAASGRTTALDPLLRQLTGAAQPGARPVALTFDDGTVDFADVAMPVLEQARVPVTLYVATDFVEAGRSFPHDGKPLSWSALADAISTGLVTIGSHTHTHALLDRLPAAEVEDELDRSVKLIEDRLGVTPQHFAYPKALLGSPSAQEAVRRRFRSAAVGGTRPNHFGATDPYRLNRSPIQVGDGMRWFRHKARGGMALEDDIRRLVNRRRYAGAVT